MAFAAAEASLGERCQLVVLLPPVAAAKAQLPASVAMPLDLSSPALWAKTVIIGALVVVMFSYKSKQSTASKRAAHKAAIEAATALAASAGKGKAAAGGAGQGAGGAGADGGGDRPGLTVLFASQTGTAEGFATAVASEARQQGFEANVACVEDYVDDDIEQLYEEKLLVLIAATYGEGEPTDDAMGFTKWLQSDEVEPGALDKLHYAVFGLGDRSYEKFCSMGHLFHKKLGELGGNPLLDGAGEGDDSADIEADFAAWKRTMWQALRIHAFGKEAGAALTYKLEHAGDTYSFEFPAPYEPQFVATLAPVGGSGAPAEPVPLRASLNPLIDGKPWVKAGVKDIRELHTKRSPRSCMHVELDLSQAARTSLLHTRYEAVRKTNAFF
jgi:sulfite reductase alpha subunit-like flavoprotein